MADFGYDRVIFSVMRDHELSEQHQKIGLIQNYPDDWQRYYSDKFLQRIDPVLRLGQTQSEPFFWSDILRRYSLTPSQIKFMYQAEEAGLNHGVGLPLLVGSQARAGIALACSAPTERTNRNLALLNAFAIHFYHRFRAMHAIAAPVDRHPITPLSLREMEVLSLQAQGFKARDISLTLGITANTIKTVQRRILVKMDEPTRMAALSRAVTLNLIKK